MYWKELAEDFVRHSRLWLYATGVTDKSLCLKLEMGTDKKHLDKLRAICGILQHDTTYIGGCEVVVAERRHLHRPPTLIVRVYADSLTRLNYFLSTHEYTDFRVTARRICWVGAGTYVIYLLTLGTVQSFF